MTAPATYPVSTIAKLLMLSERRVQQLTTEGVIQKAERGRYELAPAIQGYIRYLQERSLSSEKSPIDYHNEKSRLVKAQADIAELELMKARKEVAPIQQFERAQSMVFAQIRTNVMNVAQRIVVQLLGETDETVFKQKLRSELTLALEATANADLVIEEESEEEPKDEKSSSSPEEDDGGDL